jgi:hypothetical protein
MSKVVVMFPLISACFLFTILAAVGSCGTKGGVVNNTPMQRKEKLANGVWGGPHIHAEVTNRGADFEFDCAHVTIDQPIVLDGAGSFDIKGKYAPEHGGPIRRDEDDNGRPVHYVGRVRDQELTLKISDAGTKESLGSFTLTHGSEGRVMKCK